MDTNFINIEQYHHFSLGRIALTRGLITAAQVLESIKIQHNNPSKKIGDILVQIDAITDFQLQEMLTFQKKILSNISSWKYIPDSIFKGHVYFAQESETHITSSQIKKAESVGYQEFLTTNKVTPLAKILSEQDSSLIPELKNIFFTMNLFIMECPCCHRIYGLFDNKDAHDSLVCPVCWTVELELKHPGQLLTKFDSNTLKSTLIETSHAELKALEIPVDKIIIPHQSPGFVLVYEMLKRIEPDHREGMTRKFSSDYRTIKLVFSDMASQFFEYSKEEIEQSPKKTSELAFSQDIPQSNNEAAIVNGTQINSSDNQETRKIDNPAAENAGANQNTTSSPNPEVKETPLEYMGHKLDLPFHESPKTQMRVLKKNSLSAKAKLSSKTKKLFLLYIVFSCICFWGVYKILPSHQTTPTTPSSIPTPTITPATPSPNVQSTPEPSNISIVAKTSSTEKNIEKTSEKNSSTKKESTSSSAKIGLDNVAEKRLKILMPKFLMLANLLEKDIKSFLEKKDWKSYKNSYASWKEIYNHYIIKNLPVKDGNYTSAMADKVNKIHQLRQNIEQSALTIFQYLEANYGKAPEAKSAADANKPMEKLLMEIMKNSKAYSTILESQTLFNDLSDKDNKIEIFTEFFKK